MRSSQATVGATPTRIALVWFLVWQCLVSKTAFAEEADLVKTNLPLWELGAGVAAVSQPHYFGADDSRTYVLPIPYFKYRGEILRADRGGIRARLLESDRFSLGISGGGSFPVDSDDSDERRGMPDLDVLAEIGPNLRIDLIRQDDLQLQFQWPIRGAFSFGDDFGDYQGWTTNPRFVARMPIDDWTYVTSIGPIYSDARYHAYRYDVAPQFATADRPVYESSSGLTAWRFGFDMRRDINNMRISAFIRYFNMREAENRDSPLFRREHNVSAGVTIAWVLARSKRLVSIDDDELE